MRNPASSAIGWIHRHRPERVGRFVMPYLTAAITGLLILGLIQVGQTRDFANDLRDGLIKSCDKNGNPLREAVQKMLRDDIEQSKSPVIRRFFPYIPSGELERLIQAETKSDEATIRAIAPVDCASLYPRP